jgi:hypothetical protein
MRCSVGSEGVRVMISDALLLDSSCDRRGKTVTRSRFKGTVHVCRPHAVRSVWFPSAAAAAPLTLPALLAWALQDVVPHVMIMQTARDIFVQRLCVGPVLGFWLDTSGPPGYYMSRALVQPVRTTYSSGAMRQDTCPVHIGHGACTLQSKRYIISDVNTILP